MYDLHTHFIPQEVLSWLQDHKDTVNAKWIKKEADKDEFLVVNEKWGFELKKTFINQQLYLQKQLEAGISHSMISPIPQLFMYEFPLNITQSLSQVYNQSLAQLIAESNGSFSALGTVPLTHPEHAAVVLRDAVKIGLKGAIIGPSAAGKMLTDDYFTPFFEEANRLKAILFIHPLLSEDPRLKSRMMPNLIGVPWETTVCATDILLSGMIDKYPHIKILFAHGGGFLPYQIGRLDKGYEQWGSVSNNLKGKPSEYVKRFWYDSVLWDSNSIDFLIRTVGEDRVVPGSDFPFDLCMQPSRRGNGVPSLLE